MHSKPERILIVDDEDVFAKLIATEMKSGYGYEVTTAASGPAALELLSGKPFDVVLLDYKMPDMTGLEVLQWMQSHSVDTPVVMFTAIGSEAIAVEAMKLGAYDYLRKEHLDINHLSHVFEAVHERHTFRKERERLEREHQEIEKRNAVIEMFHRTVSSISSYMNYALAVLEMQTMNQEYALQQYIPAESAAKVKESFGKIHTEFKIISTGLSALIGFSDALTRDPSVEKGMPKLKQQLQEALRELQKLSASI